MSDADTKLRASIYNTHPKVWEYLIAGAPASMWVRDANEPHTYTVLSVHLVWRVCYENCCLSCLRMGAADSQPQPPADKGPAPPEEAHEEPLDLRCFPPLGVEVLNVAFCADCRNKRGVQETLLINLTQPPPDPKETVATEPLPEEVSEALCFENSLHGANKAHRHTAQRALKKHANTLCPPCKAGVNLTIAPNGNVTKLVCDVCIMAVAHKNRCGCGTPRFVSSVLYIPKLCNRCHKAKK